MVALLKMQATVARKLVFPRVGCVSQCSGAGNGNSSPGRQPWRFRSGWWRNQRCSMELLLPVAMQKSIMSVDDFYSAHKG